ncbi:hypothetical protein HRbin17_00609 [bacterium HR17]|jgi:hypothetical protein|uniref:Uncharacterized protein n=1 Tax=Candidatus Fervidibacter japonicus TaxID=2035412 RepID=A0A2H5XA95_9BACT|nr:hypothetical protein HRbin17_00609 [bacterium HR17]
MRLAPEQCKREALRYLPQRFGVPIEVLDRFHYLWSGGAIWLTTVPLELIPQHRAVLRVGLRALRKVPNGWKPTTPLLQLLDSHIVRHRIALTEEQWRQLLAGQPIDCVREQLPTEGWSPGYVALALGGIVVGCGYFNGRLLAHQLSKVRATELAEAFGLTSVAEGAEDDE